jgi:hypothetical protein
MNPTAHPGSVRWPLKATLFIALTALSISTVAQNVYKCGNTYGQSPCADGKVLAVEEGRDAAQKKQSDDATRRDTQLAQSLEKERLAREKLPQHKLPAEAQVTKTPGNPNSNGVVHTITPKRIKVKHHKPDAFVAEVPGSKDTNARKKPRKKPQTAN